MIGLQRNTKNFIKLNLSARKLHIKNSSKDSGKRPRRNYYVRRRERKLPFC